MILTKWSDVVERFAASGSMCLWQDLDGFHCEAPPPQRPDTSIVWAWTTTKPVTAFRVRIDPTPWDAADSDGRYFLDEQDVGEQDGGADRCVSLEEWGNLQQTSAAHLRAQPGTPDPTTIRIRQWDCLDGAGRHRSFLFAPTHAILEAK